MLVFRQTQRVLSTIRATMKLVSLGTQHLKVVGSMTMPVGVSTMASDLVFQTQIHRQFM